ncbi:PEP-CTERM sorting domain-containing protein [Aeoliella sp. ICT_H6.2]|uniref:PEP-CTERM sorting domain-containing protein n=1 Tax=Aeoliella straminimaris TaxID=2954799 RepID=A0A9X2FC28_9BACT|nr:PEP-CTERM sorting domain-containing protein [Aeoliella straminimaris]MCO6046277.1 PEP-CTERM sorting domain-containing protein [Aeoliella straminimaris]
MKYSMWDTPYQRIRNRSMPWVEVENLSDSTGNLTEFSMTIGDEDYNFTDATYGTFALLSDSTPDVLIQSVVSTGDLLTVTFGNGGLAPGETVRFGIDLAPDDDVEGLFPHPDFRLVLFDMNNMDGNGTEDNSVVTGTFVDPNNNALTESVSTQIADYEVTGNQANYFNQFIRPYGVMEGVDIFGTDVTTTVVPEPSTGVAAILAAVVGAGVLRRRR